MKIGIDLGGSHVAVRLSRRGQNYFKKRSEFFERRKRKYWRSHWKKNSNFCI